MGSPDDRRTPRYNVNLAIRFDTAVDFVTEYAENISSGGLFVRGGEGLQPLQELGVTLALPGLGKFAVGVRVAHVLTPEIAQRFGKPPGVGVEIVFRPPGFDAAMGEYLRRLGARHDHAVLCHDDEPLGYFRRMGYQALPLPGMGDLADALAKVARKRQRLLAVVVPPDAARLFEVLLERVGADPALLRVATTADELDALLTELDQQL